MHVHQKQATPHIQGTVKPPTISTESLVFIYANFIRHFIDPIFGMILFFSQPKHHNYYEYRQPTDNFFKWSKNVFIKLIKGEKVTAIMQHM